MADLRIAVFGGIRNDIQASEINPGQFADGQNFMVDPFGSLTKRNGISKIYTTAFDKAVVGIADLITKWGKRKHIFVETLQDYIWSDDPTIPYPGPTSDDPAIPDPQLDPVPKTATGCCNYGDLLCAPFTTLTQCLDTLDGNYWKEGGDCSANSAINCLNTGSNQKEVTGYTWEMTIEGIVSGSGILTQYNTYIWWQSDSTWYIALSTHLQIATSSYTPGSGPITSYTDKATIYIPYNTTQSRTYYYWEDAQWKTVAGTLKITPIYT